MKDAIHVKLVEHWKKINYRISYRPVPESQIFDLEENYDIKIPAVFRKYLMEASPEPHGGEMDDSYASWWSFKHIKSTLDVYGHHWINSKLDGDDRKYLPFADHCISCWDWAICCEAGANYGSIFYFGDGIKIANSFTDFVNKYISDYPNYIGTSD